jgi:hypothetical protein
MKVMENAISIARRGKGFRKLRWRNYLHHLLSLWLCWGGFSAEGLRNEISPNEARSTANVSTSPGNRSLQSTSASNFAPNHDPTSSTCESCYGASNKSSSIEMLFRLSKPTPDGLDSSKKSINQAKSLDHSSVAADGPAGHGMPENEVNSRNRIINDTAEANWQVKKPKSSAVSGNVNEFSIHYDQSSLSKRNQTKKSKSVRKKPAGKARSASKLSKVSLLGLFELTTHLGKVRWEGKSELAAAELAVRHINERGLLPGYILELITNDTQVTQERSRLHPIHQLRLSFAILFSLPLPRS